MDLYWDETVVEFLDLVERSGEYLYSFELSEPGRLLTDK
jgi:hypothetical protein